MRWRRSPDRDRCRAPVGGARGGHGEPVVLVLVVVHAGGSSTPPGTAGFSAGSRCARGSGSTRRPGRMPLESTMNVSPSPRRGNAKSRMATVSRDHPEQRLPRDEDQRDVARIAVVRAVLAGEQRVDRHRPDAARPPVQDEDVHEPLVHREHGEHHRRHERVGALPVALDDAGNHRGDEQRAEHPRRRVSGRTRGRPGDSERRRAPAVSVEVVDRLRSLLHGSLKAASSESVAGRSSASATSRRAGGVLPGDRVGKLAVGLGGARPRRPSRCASASSAGS